jgi:alpha-tubulin suppressor-like RCC1 family protein
MQQFFQRALVRRLLAVSVVLLVLCAVPILQQRGTQAVTAQSRLSPSTQISLGNDYSCALLTTGVVKCWGGNSDGQLGLGNTDSYGDAVSETGTGLPAVDLNQTAKYISAGYVHTCAIRADNSTVCWGENFWGTLGNGSRSNIGDTSGEMGSSLIAVDLSTDYATSLSAGYQFTCAILNTGQVKCWGLNDVGQTGADGWHGMSSDTMGTNLPAVDLGDGRTAKAIATGRQHACAILDNNTVKCWGANTYGQLGLGNTTSLVYPNIGEAAVVNLGNGRTAKAIAAGSHHTCAILDTGNLKCWGFNASGQLGQDTAANIGDSSGEMGDSLPAINLGTNRTAVAVAGNKRGDLDYTCAVLDNATLKCWGSNQLFNLGQSGGDLGDSAGEMAALAAVDLGTGIQVTAVAMGAAHSCQILSSTNIKCFGHGQNGKLGYGDTITRGWGASTMGDNLPIVDLDGVEPTATSTPVDTDTPTPTDTATPTDTPTPTHTPSVTNTPTVTRTASKTYTRSKTPTRSKTKTKTRTPTKSKTPTRTPVGYVSRVAAVASGTGHSCAILASSVVKCWGRNDYGQLGLGDTSDRGDASGEMGNALPAVNLGTGVIARNIYAGVAHSCVITTTGRVKCWGSNIDGELGLGDTDSRGDASSEMGENLPYVDLGAERTAVSLSLGIHYSCALLDNATVVCWGRSDDGQLGNGSTDTIGDVPGEMGTALVPVDVGTDRTVISMANHQYGICALLDNASIKCWGYNVVGQLGIGDTVDRGDGVGLMGDNLPVVPFSADLTPVELAGAIGSTCARFDDGTVRCWGFNLFGQLGTGDALDRGDSPGEIAALAAIDLGSGHTAKRIFGESGYSFCALLDDDSLKCWGDNSDANLGIGISITDTKWGNATGEMGDNLPAIDLGTNVTIGSVSVGNKFRCAILKPSTALKCWGANAYGQLGLGTTEASWGEYPDATMGDFLPYVRLGSIIPSTSTPTPTKSKTPTKTLSPSRTKSPTKTLSPTRTVTQTRTPTP